LGLSAVERAVPVAKWLEREGPPFGASTDGAEPDSLFRLLTKARRMDFAHALHEAEKWVDEVEGVESVSEGVHDGEPCITVFVSSRTAARILPNHLGDWSVVIEPSELPPD
jgi:hypothetical protein